MKNWKTMLALAASLSLCAAMVGCGDTGKKDSSSKSGNSSIATEGEVGEASSSPAIEATAGSEAEETTEAPKENSALYKHYDLLAAEYEKKGNTSPVSLKDNYAYHDGKVIFAIMKGYECNLCVYDINTKKLIESAVYANSSYTDIWYYNGYIYVSDSSQEFIKKYDLEGSEIASIKDIYFYNTVITDKGHIWTCKNNHGNFEYFIVSPDLNTATPVPPLKVKDSHGLEQEISSVTSFAAYGNKIFVCEQISAIEYAVHYYDIDSNTWNSNKNTFEKGFQTDFSLTVGKYCLFGISSVGIYDMEADEIITDSISHLGNNTIIHNDRFNNYAAYFGGKNNIIMKDCVFYRIQYPEGDNKVAFEELNPVALGTDKSIYVYPISDTYYIFKDDAGIFLRTYEKGETEEEIVYVFNN